MVELLLQRDDVDPTIVNYVRSVHGLFIIFLPSLSLFLWNSALFSLFLTCFRCLLFPVFSFG
jgi:hypothetical protein